MRNRQLYVQFFIPSPYGRNNIGSLLECLRYAGKLIYTIEHNGWVVALAAPKGVEQATWCDQQAARMKSFGFKVDVVENAKQAMS